MKTNISPMPREVKKRAGQLCLRKNAGAGISIAEPASRPAAELLANRLDIPILQNGCDTEAAKIRLRLVKKMGFADRLRADLRVEAYRLTSTASGIDIEALTAEGLLRGTATLLQMLRQTENKIIVPYAEIRDWPAFRHRCAADWLVNVEINRWAYDWGDGRKAFMGRVKRKLNFCFDHKINMVWFDGSGWDTKRFPGYAAMMKECNRHARKLGIKLEFGGYGGGYGTAYQRGELYRCGYFGKVHCNRYPYPNGKKYACRGWKGVSRFYGTCFSNEKLRLAKLKEMKRFVTEVNPGFMYIHDIDAGSWLPAAETWKNRCDACRKRWPNDEISAADGMAGACASWFGQVRRELSALPAVGDYIPARDLVLIFTGPLYTHYHESAPENVWELEMQYFVSLSRLIGPEPGIEFGVREQFYHDERRKKIGALRERLEQINSTHGISVLSFGGGDNYISDELTNISGAMAHFYDGAESVYLSNGEILAEPVQMLNAEFLWSGSAEGYNETPANETAAVALFKKIGRGEHRPPAVFSAAGHFDRLCCRLWGRRAGKLMSRALRMRSKDGRLPVSHAWWTITVPIDRFGNDQSVYGSYCLANCEREWADREHVTAAALQYARKAAAISDNEDIHWFASRLEVGRRFAESLKLLARLKAGNDKTAGVMLNRALIAFEKHLRSNFKFKKTDILGGDQGCWKEIIASMKRLHKTFLQSDKSRDVTSDFIADWLVSKPVSAAKQDELIYPDNREAMRFKAVNDMTTNGFCHVPDNICAQASGHTFLYFACRIDCDETMRVKLLAGYDGGPVSKAMKVWIDGKQVFYDPAGEKAGKRDKAVISWNATKGSHELMIGLSSDDIKWMALAARFRGKIQTAHIHFKA